MFTMSRRSLAIAGALSASMVWAQADDGPSVPAPPAPRVDVDDAATGDGVDTNAGTGVDAEAGVDLNAPPATELDPGPDVRPPANTTPPIPPVTPRTGDRVEGPINTNGRPIPGASAGTSPQVDASRRPALGVIFRTEGDALVIGRVYPNSPAFRMGLRPGDRIIRFNGEAFDDTRLFITAAGLMSLDEDAEIVYLRDGQEFTQSGRLAPWTEVFVDDDDDATPRGVLRPDLDDPDDVEDAIEDGAVVPAQPVPVGEVEVDDDGVDIDDD
jgi:hypothetical protein